MPREVSRLVVAVTLLALFGASSHAVPHARPAHHACPCGHHGDADGPAPAFRDGAEVADADSPCAGGELPCRSCPCPGGCAFCNVAKVFGPPAPPAPADVTPCAGDGPEIAAPIYDPPSRGTPTRPPRS